jgi:hypothetical protein
MDHEKKGLLFHGESLDCGNLNLPLDRRLFNIPDAF